MTQNPSTETTITPVETLPLKRFEMPADRVEVRLSVETADLTVEVAVSGELRHHDQLLEAATVGLEAALVARPAMTTLVEQRAADVANGGQACRECGCTANAGCSPPCWWAEADLCSACAATS